MIIKLEVPKRDRPGIGCSLCLPGPCSCSCSCSDGTMTRATTQTPTKVSSQESILCQRTSNSSCSPFHLFRYRQPLSVEKCPKSDRIFLESNTLFCDLSRLVCSRNSCRRLKAILHMMKKSIKHNVVEKVKLCSNIFSMTILNYCVFKKFSPGFGRQLVTALLLTSADSNQCKMQTFSVHLHISHDIYFCYWRCKTYSLICGADRHQQNCR